MGRSLLDLEEVSRPYGEQSEWYALRDASLQIHEGEFVAIVGPSGSGKSTLLNILGLLDEQWTGSYAVGGVDVRSLTSAQRDHLRSRTFGFVFQSSYVNPWDSVVRNVAFAKATQGATLRDQRQSALEALQVVGLEEKANSLARFLSGGERQRLAIARAISSRPSILLADEPTGNLDTQSTQRIVELFQALNKRGTTVILITHDMDVAAFAGRVITVRDGLVASRSASDDAATSTPFPLARSYKTRRRPGAVLADRFARAVNNATSRPLRSLALAAAFGLAIAGLVAASGVGSSASLQIADRLDTAARDEVRVALPPTATASERDRWVSTIGALPFVEDVGVVGTVEASLARPSQLGLFSFHESPSAPTVTMDGATLRVLGATISRNASVEDWEEGERIALVGAEIADSLGVGTDSYGQEIWIARRPYAVVGTISSSDRESSLSSSVVIPLQAEFSSSTQLLVRTTTGYPAAVADAIPVALSPGSPGSVQVSTVGDLRNLRVGVTSDLQGLLLSLSGALLLLAVLSVSTAMFLAVQARMQELALSRALGMSPLSIGLVFVFEGALMGLGGALIGIAGGLSIAVIVAAIQGWTFVVPWETLALAPLIGLIAGACSSAAPALRAARINPADAIR